MKMLKIKGMLKKQTSQSDLPVVLHFLKNNGTTLPEMNNNFIKVLSPIPWYHHAQNQGYVKKTDKSHD